MNAGVKINTVACLDHKRQNNDGGLSIVAKFAACIIKKFVHSKEEYCKASERITK
jgi:hypothetical protein